MQTILSLPNFLLPFLPSSRNPNREEESILILLLTHNWARQLDKAGRKEIVSSILLNRRILHEGRGVV